MLITWAKSGILLEGKEEEPWWLWENCSNFPTFLKVAVAHRIDMRGGDWFTS